MNPTSTVASSADAGRVTCTMQLEGLRDMLRFHISNKWERQQVDHASGPIEFGRGPKRGNAKRFVIKDDLCVSRDHVRVEETSQGRVRVDNLSTRNPILQIGSNALPPGT